MICRLPFSYESIIKIILIIVLAILVVNIYILSIIFTSENSKNKPLLQGKDAEEIFIKGEPFKKYSNIHDHKQSPKKALFVQTNTTELAKTKILKSVINVNKGLFSHSSLLSSKSKRSFKALLEDVTVTQPTSADLLKEMLLNINGRELFPEVVIPPIGRVINSLNNAHIEKSENLVLGTQLKLILSLEGGLKAAFKPQWYRRTEIISGDVYAGKDRHNGEVAAFFLSWLLGLRRVPLTVGRKINLRQEIIPTASPNLLETIYQEGNNTCFYGVCYYCSPKDPVCASQDILEGALILWLPTEFPLKKFRHPWQRTYKPNVPARWELDSGYCQFVRKSVTYSRGPRLLDIIDTAIFDFIIDNGDRHHYEVFQNINDSAVLLIDNGKSFGNPNVDHIDILAPLYQCCRLRQTTWSRLLWLHGETVSGPMRRLLMSSAITPVLTEAHLLALDRRLTITIATVNVCFDERNGYQNVIVSD